MLGIFKNCGIASLFILVAIGLFSCGTPPSPEVEIQPYQKKAEIEIQNNNYQMTNQKLNEITKRYEGFIKNSTLKTEGKAQNSADFDILVPYTYFNELIGAIHENFKNEIKTELISQEESLSRQFRTVSTQIVTSEAQLEQLKAAYSGATSVSEKTLAKYELEKEMKSLSVLELKRLSMLEDLNFSLIRVHWQHSGFCTAPVSFYGDDETAVCGDRPAKEIVFDRIGQEEDFSADQPVKIIYQGIDPNETKIISNVDFEKNKVKMKVAKKNDRQPIFLEKKCQIVNVGLGPLPEIFVTGDVAGEQVVITPRVDKMCNVIGYEIRAGSIESGCTKGRNNLKRLKKCHGKMIYDGRMVN